MCIYMCVFVCVCVCVCVCECACACTCVMHVCVCEMYRCKLYLLALHGSACDYHCCLLLLCFFSLPQNRWKLNNLLHLSLHCCFPCASYFKLYSLFITKQCSKRNGTNLCVILAVQFPDCVSCLVHQVMDETRDVYSVAVVTIKYYFDNVPCWY